jgi:hypothetical protein
MSKLTADAFTLYVALGPERSYDAVAKHYGASKKTVTRVADREQWQARLEAIERKAREATDAKLSDELHEMSLRHRKLLLAMASRAATAIQTFPLENGMQGVKAAELVIKLERLIAGEPTESRAVSVEQVTRDEIGRFLIDEADDEQWEEERDSDGGDAQQGDSGGEEALET